MREIRKQVPKHFNIQARFLSFLGASILVWFAKIVQLKLSHASFVLSLIGVVLGFVALLVVTRILLLDVTARGNTYRAAILTALFFTSLQIIPLAPDTWNAFAHEVNHPWLWLLGAYFFVLLLMSFFRALPLVFSPLLFKSTELVGFKRTVVTLFLMFVSESMVLAVVPIAYWEALPVPVPLHKWDHTQGNTSAVVLVNPKISDKRREELFNLGYMGVEHAGSVLASATDKKLMGHAFDKVTIVLPETTLFIAPEGFSHLFRVVRSKMSVHVERLTLIVGAKFMGDNLVYYGSLDAGGEGFAHGVLKIKQSFVPFFETSILGLQTRGEDEKSAGTDLSSLLVHGETEPLSGERTGICYEALNLGFWEFGEPRLVLTNHFLFSRFGLASQLYDYNLRLLARLFSAQLTSVGNFGGVGVDEGGRGNEPSKDMWQNASVFAVELDEEL